MSEKEKNELTVLYEIDGNEVKLTPTIVQNFLVNGDANITLPEFKMFTEMCKVRKLNPFLKEAYIIKYSEKSPATIVVGKDAILKRAVLHRQYNGREQGIIVVNLKGEIEERQGTFKLADEDLVGGWARVFRKDVEHPTYISVSFDEVKQEKTVYSNGKPAGKELNSSWASKPCTMVEKVALVRALRETFVEELSGMIDADEAWTEVASIPKRDKKAEIIEQIEPEIVEGKATLNLDEV